MVLLGISALVDHKHIGVIMLGISALGDHYLPDYLDPAWLIRIGGVTSGPAWLIRIGGPYYIWIALG